MDLALSHIYIYILCIYDVILSYIIINFPLKSYMIIWNPIYIYYNYLTKLVYMMVHLNNPCIKYLPHASFAQAPGLFEARIKQMAALN